MLRDRFARIAMWTSLVLVATTFAGQAMAQNVVLSPRSIVVNPVPAFDLEVWVDKDPRAARPPPTPSARRSGSPCDPPRTPTSTCSASPPTARSCRSCPTATTTSFAMPSSAAARPAPSRPSGARYTFNVAPPGGLAKVIAVASRRPLDTSTLATFRSERDFATSDFGEEGFARALRIIVNPLPQNEWVSATALYYVGNRPSRAPTARCRSTASRAAPRSTSTARSSATPRSPTAAPRHVRRRGRGLRRQRVRARPGPTRPHDRGLPLAAARRPDRDRHLHELPVGRRGLRRRQLRRHHPHVPRHVRRRLLPGRVPAPGQPRRAGRRSRSRPTATRASTPPCAP
jgi:hypothetical protein